MNSYRTDKQVQFPCAIKIKLLSSCLCVPECCPSSSLFCNICNVSAILLTVLSRPQNGHHMKFEQNKGLLIFSNVFCPLFSIPHPAPEIGLKYSQTLNIYSFLPAELIFYPTLVRGLECCNSFHLSILALERYIIERRVLHLMRKIPWFSINFQATLTTGVH